MAIHQCCVCGKKIDDQEDSYEAHEVVHARGTHWRYYHAICIDDVRSREHRIKAMGKKPKQTVPASVRSIRAAWTQETVL